MENPFSEKLENPWEKQRCFAFFYQLKKKFLKVGGGPYFLENTSFPLPPWGEKGRMRF